MSRQGELDRAKRQLARAADRDRLVAIKRKLREVKRAKPERIRAIRGYCRLGRENAKQAIARLREDVRAELAARVQALRDAQRGDCQVTRERTRNELDTRIVSAAKELEMQREHMRKEYGRKSRSSSSRVSASQGRREVREESDDEVRRNLPAELVPVFDSVRRRIQPEKRRTRTEVFLEWVESNPDEAHAIIYRDVDRTVQRMIDEQRAIDRRRARRYDAESSLAALEAVPF
jgi:hypothetical protein